MLTRLIQNADEYGTANIGDIIIRKGMQYVLNSVFNNNVEWVLISRFSQMPKEDLDILSTCDAIIYTGMPQYNNLDEWCFYYDDKIWDDLIALKKPILRLAGGGGYPSETILPEEFSKYLRKSKKTMDVLEKAMKYTVLTTVRDYMAQTFLHDCNFKSTLLPCTGTFGCYDNNIYTTTKKFNAICLDAGHLKGRENIKDIIPEFIKTKKYLEKTENKPCKIIAQVPHSDQKFLEGYFDNADIATADNVDDMIEIYKDIDICISSRLHCALPIHGIGGRSILIKVDSRGTAGHELMIPVINFNEYSFEKVKHIIEADLFSKKSIEESLEHSINFYQKNLRILNLL